MPSAEHGGSGVAAAEGEPPVLPGQQVLPLEAVPASGVADRSRWVALVPYAALWVAFCAASYAVLSRVPAETPMFDAPEYGFMVAAGLTLMAVAPAIAVAMRIVSGGPGGPAGATAGVWSIMFRLAAVALGGAMCWVAILLALDVQRTGGL